MCMRDAYVVKGACHKYMCIGDIEQCVHDACVVKCVHHKCVCNGGIVQCVCVTLVL